MIARLEDQAFWPELRAACADNPRAILGLGVITLMTSQVMGPFAPPELTSWTVDMLPLPVRVWIELYGHRVILEE